MISIVIPANNEEGYIGTCLEFILASDDPGGPVQVVVAANGCTDETIEEARSYAPQFHLRGWQIDVVEIEEGNKVKALNAGDSVAKYGIRVYVDADIHMTPGLIRGLVTALDFDAPRYASGKPRIRKADSFVSERYARFWEQLPFMKHGVPGCGVYAVNTAGRARWGEFPQVVADDTFVRYHFMENEMVPVEATYSWPITEGFANLVRVRRRQDTGLEEIRRLYPDLAARVSPTAPNTLQKCLLFLKDPLGFLIYSGIALVVRAPVLVNRSQWERGR